MPKQTKTLIIFATFAAFAYIATYLIHPSLIPSFDVLKYDPKDIFIVMLGFLYGPAAALPVITAVSFLEMFTIPNSGGPFGLLMNILSSSAFSCTAALIYKYRRRISGAVIGLITGCILTAAVMLLWNYLIVPIYTGAPRAVVVKMLVPIFLPFNLLKTVLNASIVMILYKPVSVALDASGFKVERERETAKKSGPNAGVILVSAFVLASTIMIIFAIQGKI